MAGMSVVKFRLSAALKLGARSGWVPSMPVSMMPTVTPSPVAVAWATSGVAPIICMPHWSDENVSGPVSGLDAAASLTPLDFTSAA
jgi:hypothetical protein